MELSILILAAVAALAVLSLRREPDDTVERHRGARWVLRIALVLMGACAALWVLWGLGEMTTGELSGAVHLVPGVAMVPLTSLARKRPAEGGITLSAVGVLASAFYLIRVRGEWALRFQAALIGAVPYLVIGLLLLAAVALARRSRRKER